LDRRRCHNSTATGVTFCDELLLSATAACLPTSPGETGAFQRGTLRWAARAPASYQIVLQRSSCECLPEWLIPVRVTVRDHEVQSVIDVRTGDPVTTELYHAMTVEQLFAVIASAQDQNAYRVNVEYDQHWGYPRDIYIDYDREMVDDELSITAQDLIPVE
jgi:hypothetical protein